MCCTVAYGTCAHVHNISYPQQLVALVFEFKDAGDKSTNVGYILYHTILLDYLV